MDSRRQRHRKRFQSTRLAARLHTGTRGTIWGSLFQEWIHRVSLIIGERLSSRMSPLTRSPRLSVNPPNALLNFLHSLLESEARLALSALGLDPGIGVLHSDTRTRASLACDLMEPVRPQVDAFLLDWPKRSPLRREWFLEGKKGTTPLRCGTSPVAALSGHCVHWRPFSAVIRSAQSLPNTSLRSVSNRTPLRDELG
jgi:hypothetical protein